MIELMDAIIAAYKAAPTPMGLTAGAIFQGIANKATFDYVTVSCVPTGGATTYGAHQLGESVVTFSIWSVGGGSVAAREAKDVLSIFRDNLLSLSGGTVLNVQIARPPMLISQSLRDEQGRQVSQCSFDLRYSVELY